MLQEIGKIIITFGVILVLFGIFLSIGGKIPFINKLGHLPGDIIIKKDNFVFYFPITTCILVSLILLILFSLFRR